MHRVFRTEQVCVSGCCNAEFLAQLSMNLQRITAISLALLSVTYMYITLVQFMSICCVHIRYLCLKKICWGGGGGGHFSMCVIRVQGNHMVH